MLRLILGRARSGKTARCCAEIRDLVSAETGGNVLLVPEQYSHEAERELLGWCGDRLSLYAEVLSFKRLAARVEAETGGWPRPLDQGGRVLALARALAVTETRLRQYGAARRSMALQSALLSAIDELKSAGIAPGELETTAELLRAEGEPLADKLADLALLYEAFEAIVAQSGLDPMERLNILAERVGESSFARFRYWVDGFTDFTGQELRVLEALLRAGAELTVCLGTESLEERLDIFEPSRRAALRLRRMAEELGQDCALEPLPGRTGEEPMTVLERELFSFTPGVHDSLGRVRLVQGMGAAEECEAAARRCLELVRADGCRWRDIAVAARDFERYRAPLESVFARYGVPLYQARRSDLLTKPLPALILGAYAVVCRGWEQEDVLAYCKTGLAGLDRSECDAVEDYAFLWSLRGSAWSEDRDWSLHPGGFGLDFDEAAEERLRALNALRRRLTGPLRLLARRGRAAEDALGQACALADFFEALELPALLEARAAELEALGLSQEAGEYEQLWAIVAGALEQSAAILGDAPMGMEDFGELYALVLSAYDVGTIPLSLDKVTAGDMERMRRRHLRHLIVLGCDSESLPRTETPAGIFSDRDREALSAAGLDVGDAAEGRLRREFALIYQCLSLPEESIQLSWHSGGEEGRGSPSFLARRCGELFGLSPERVDLPECRSWAPGPAYDLAAMAGSPAAAPLHRAARRWFEAQGETERLRRLEYAASLGRGRLSRRAVRALYGETPRLSASRVESLSECAFGFFLRYGLSAKPRQSAEFRAPEKGSFLHYVLEHVARELKESHGGFRDAQPAVVEELTERWVAQYVHDRLWDFREKSPRFIHLFRRLSADVKAIVTDMVRELSRGDFVPLDFELDFGDRSQFPPLKLGEGADTLVLAGIADRVDGWEQDGTLYLRVVDYKTGKKKFSLSDVWYGMGLQMLLYLFALEREGAERYGKPVAPAGVLYVPARDEIVGADTRLTPEALLAEKAKKLRRSGLLLAQPEVLEAMERGEEKRYLPVRFNKPDPEALADAAQLGRLARHVDRSLRDLAATLRRGGIEADPWFRSQTENACRFCDYREACLYDETRDAARWLRPMNAGEVWEKLAEEDSGKPDVSC